LTIIKAELISQDSTDNITFMYNPVELRVSRSMRLNPSAASTEDGHPKVSFSHPDPYSLSISNILFDTYETGANVRDSYISKFEQAVEYVGTDTKRPPAYIFTWGSHQYFRCFVKSLTYRLTLFLSDGTPVRAIVDLTLEQIDEVTSTDGGGTPAPSTANRETNNRSTPPGTK
jgi:hypothetical protein